MKKVILALTVLLFSACAQPSVKPQNQSLENTKYKLVSFGMKRMAVPPKAWIQFKEGRYSGNAGCNGMGGAYILEDKQLTIKPGMSTLMACPQMGLETKFRQELDKVTTYRVEGKILVLMHEQYDVLNFIEIPSE